ncbi:hypothetical protein [Pluralibacter gergoviae]|uniref:hypothetical protein n=1 Tax=Pluralibacter gergoviae TaxID=61647 RepID=UPI00187CFB9B|nr:hypothetical protein [Pluralibacter gergoviae]
MTGKRTFSNLTRTGLRLLFGYDGGITIIMLCAPGMGLAIAIIQNSITDELLAVGRQPDRLSGRGSSRCGE